MSDIILAIRPKWTDLILSGRKTTEVRRPGCIHLADPVRYHTPKPFNGPIVQNFIYAL